MPSSHLALTLRPDPAAPSHPARPPPVLGLAPPPRAWVGEGERRLAAARADRLYRTYGPAVYRRCLRLLRNRDAALDATQDVFVKLVRDLAKVAGRGPILTWLYRVTTNHCLNTLRTAHFRGEDRLELDLAPPAEPPGDPSSDRLLARAVLRRFDEVTQAIAVAVLVDGMAHEEVAGLLGLSRRSVARKLERFLDGARAFLAASAGRGLVG